MDIINACLEHFNFTLPSDLLRKRQNKYLMKTDDLRKTHGLFILMLMLALFATVALFCFGLGQSSTGIDLFADSRQMA